ncbi:glycoside hydrolase family 97 protein [Pedobacter cryophilus]|uniref:Glycoside hydrolase family 97 protein n=1 Tax=Pedobacter cryophilus TaxID=2571271 RepID=A0A4U1BTE4_9SPHI|nr:glycoside hydrolase family 97 protein [Pedobacter cryophilus]TKB95725.1 glycoside hydrolase family 97 protein [Pedobacter cryophilus]
MKFIYLLIFSFLSVLNAFAHQNSTQTILSPDKNIAVTIDASQLFYSVKFKDKTVLKNSKLGIVREDEDFTKDLKVLKVAQTKTIQDNYVMLNAKRKDISYTANQLKIETKSTSGKLMNMVFQVSNDGLAFRYEFPEKDKEVKKIKSESTSFHFVEGSKAWLQPKTNAQTGFEHTNPSYEAHYMMDIPVGRPSNSENGWVYPALFKTDNVWLMITEAGLENNYCGTALQQFSPNGEYKINFPQAAEKIKDGALNPQSSLPWLTPWRIIAIGDLKTIMESTLGTDLALPAKKMDMSFVKPGKSSWSWVLEKDGATIYPVQKKYIDYAADMNWQYCLIDANWDETIGYDSVKLLADYAKQKNVGLLLWYNSAGDWNTVKFTPKDKLLTHESREQEFSRLQKMGIKGVKIDFFGGDGQSMIAYYHDILEDAAKYQLLVNFHGATLPRGWHRTYPNLMTAEAIYGYEMITFGQDAANKAPSHSVMSAMVRNAFDPMDFTPMVLNKIPNIKRTTTAAFELATSITFLSGIQHYAETPSGMATVPPFVKTFLKAMPNNWDDVKFIDGYPGKLYVVARRTGNKWYVAGINGEKIEKQLSLDLSFLKNKTGQIISSGKNDDGYNSFDNKTIKIADDGNLKLDLKGNDGFIMVFE